MFPASFHDPASEVGRLPESLFCRAKAEVKPDDFWGPQKPLPLGFEQLFSHDCGQLSVAK